MYYTIYVKCQVILQILSYKIKNTKIIIYNVLQSVKYMISHNILYI